MLSLSKRGKVQNLSCEKDFYLIDILHRPNLTRQRWTSRNSRRLWPRRWARGRLVNLATRRCWVWGPLWWLTPFSFFALILPDSTSRLFFLKKGPNVLDTFLHVLYNHSNYFLYFTKCYDNRELKSSIVKYSSQVMLWNFCLFGDHWK